MKFSNRARDLSLSATMAATLEARRLIEAGEDIILATVGEPDGDASPVARRALVRHAELDPFKYGSAQGLPQVRQAIAHWMSTLYEQNFGSAQIAVTPGSKYALFALLFCLCEAGDEVVVPTPAWVSYQALAQLTGATVRIVPCTQAERFRLSARALGEVLKRTSRVLMLNSPGNPTGGVYTIPELQALADVLNGFPDVTILCDDIYNQLVFDGSKRAPHLLDVADASLKRRIVVIHGASKSFALTGWRIGWIAGEKVLVDKVTELLSQTLTSLPHFLQTALRETLEANDGFPGQLRDRIGARFKRAALRLREVEGLTVFESGLQGAFYLWLGLPQERANCELVARELLIQAKVALVPGAAFGCVGHLRLSLTLPDDRLDEAVSRIIKYFKVRTRC